MSEANEIAIVAKECMENIKKLSVICEFTGPRHNDARSLLEEMVDEFENTIHMAGVHPLSNPRVPFRFSLADLLLEQGTLDQRLLSKPIERAFFFSLYNLLNEDVKKLLEVYGR